MSEKPVYLVIGHLTPTDGDPDPDVQGKLDDGIGVVRADSRAEAEVQLLWYQDGVIVEMPR